MVSVPNLNECCTHGGIPMATDTAKLTLRLPPALYASLKTTAKTAGISLNALICVKLADGLQAAPREIFDITDGGNKYQPCPECGVKIGMGLSSRRGKCYVQCGHCEAKGPQVPDGGCEQDKAAFDAWNGMKRLQAAPKGWAK